MNLFIECNKNILLLNLKIRELIGRKIQCLFNYRYKN